MLASQPHRSRLRPYPRAISTRAASQSIGRGPARVYWMRTTPIRPGGAESSRRRSHSFAVDDWRATRRVPLRIAGCGASPSWRTRAICVHRSASNYLFGSRKPPTRAGGFDLVQRHRGHGHLATLGRSDRALHITEEVWTSRPRGGRRAHDEHRMVIGNGRRQ